MATGSSEEKKEDQADPLPAGKRRRVYNRPAGVAGIIGLVVIAALLFIYVPILFYLIGIGVCICLLRISYGKEVYILFYTFFGFASISFLVALYLHSARIVDIGTFEFSDLSGLENGNRFVEILRWLIHLTTDAKGEFEFVGLFLGLAFIPQLLSYLAAGVFGCGRPPAFVQTLTSLALLSLVKFFCGYAGINLGVAICRAVEVESSTHNYLMVLEHIGRSIEPLFLSFFLAVINAGFWPFLGMFRIRARTKRWVSLTLGFMVRHVEVELALQPYETSLVGSDEGGLRDVEERADLGLSGRFKDLLERDKLRQPVQDGAPEADVERLAGLIAERVSSRLKPQDAPHADRIARRISWLIDHCLIEVPGNKTAPGTLYVDAADRRLWEKTIDPLHWRAGFNAPTLAVITPEEAERKYGYKGKDRRASE